MAAKPTIEYGILPIQNFRVSEINVEKKVMAMEIDGKTVQPTTRFWTSLCAQFSNYGLSTKLFRMFEHHEVFERLHKVLNEDGQLQKTHLRYALEVKDGHDPILLAVTNPMKALVRYDQVGELMAARAAEGTEYSEGVVRSTHAPAHMPEFMIGPDSFAHQFVVETPVDGYGDPLIYLSLLRRVCSNGAIGYSRAFRSEIKLGRGDEAATAVHTLERALDTFNNEEGYQALRSRFESATNSWTSIYEANRVFKVLAAMGTKNMFIEDPTHQSPLVESLSHRRSVALGGDGASQGDANPITLKILRAYTQLTGDICDIYGLAQLDSLSEKKQRRLPVRCTIYDFTQFMAEVATHHCSQKDGRLLQSEIGSLISHEYDLEGTKETKATFQEWFLKADDEGNRNAD